MTGPVPVPPRTPPRTPPGTPPATPPSTPPSIPSSLPDLAARLAAELVLGPDARLRLDLRRLLRLGRLDRGRELRLRLLGHGLRRLGLRRLGPERAALRQRGRRAAAAGRRGARGCSPAGPAAPPAEDGDEDDGGEDDQVGDERDPRADALEPAVRRGLCDVTRTFSKSSSPGSGRTCPRRGLVRRRARHRWHLSTRPPGRAAPYTKYYARRRPEDTVDARPRAKVPSPAVETTSTAEPLRGHLGGLRLRRPRRRGSDLFPPLRPYHQITSGTAMKSVE